MCTKVAFRRARTPFSNPLCPCRLRPASRRDGGRTGKTEVDGSDPPFLLPGAGAGVLRKLHLRSTPWGGRSRPNYPCRKARRKNEDRVDLSPQTPQWRQNPSRLTLPPVNLTLFAGGPAPPNPPDAKRHIPTKDLSKEGPCFVSTTSPPYGKSKISHRVLRFASSSALPPGSPAPSRTRAICFLPWIARTGGRLRRWPEPHP